MVSRCIKTSTRKTGGKMKITGINSFLGYFKFTLFTQSFANTGTLSELFSAKYCAFHNPFLSDRPNGILDLIATSKNIYGKPFGDPIN